MLLRFLPTLLVVGALYLTASAIAANTTTNGGNQTGFRGLLHRLVPQTNFSERQCSMCHFAVGLVQYALKTKRGYERVQAIANSFCRLAHLQTPVVCSKITKLFSHEITKVLSNGLVTPAQICGLVSGNKCGHFHNPMDQWEVNLNVSASLNQDDIGNMRRIIQQKRKPMQPYRFIHLSDTHVDLKYQPGSPALCKEPLCCRSDSTPSTTTTSSASANRTLAGKWGTYTSCDVPLATLDAALRQINATLKASDDIAYIIWTGDILPHDVWESNRANARATYEQVFAKISEHLPNIKIFPTIGNHEMVPVDSFSPSSMLDIAREDSPEWLYKELDRYWSRWLPDDTVATITKDGFYALTVRTGLKLISLNTNFCHKTNFWLYINSTDPGNQLQWLVHELQISELEHEQVHIVGHIPPGKDDCLKVWSWNFNRIIRRFSNTISGLFFGHTHTNEFEIYYDHEEPLEEIKEEGEPKMPHSIVLGSNTPLNNTTTTTTTNNSSQPVIHEYPASTPIAVGFIGSSVTTFEGLNPSFTIRTVDPNKGYRSTDYELIYMNLTAANLAPEGTQPQWTSAGQFTKLFSVADTTANSLHQLMLDIGQHELRHEPLIVAQPLDLPAPLVPMDSNELPHAPINSGHEDQGSPTVGPMATADSKLYRLLRTYYSFSDVFGDVFFETMSLDQKRQFVCAFLTSQSHSKHICDQFVPHV